MNPFNKPLNLFIEWWALQFNKESTHKNLKNTEIQYHTILVEGLFSIESCLQDEDRCSLTKFQICNMQQHVILVTLKKS